MKGKVKKVMCFNMYRYKDVERKLERLAAKGRILEQAGPFLWTFRKAEPEKRHYTMTYFSEGSIFNPEITENQQTYFDYAKASSWEFVTQSNQLQIFCSQEEHPVPFETDEREQFENIKKCMKKSLLPSLLLLIVVFSFNLLVQLNSFQRDLIQFLSSMTQLFSVLIVSSVVLYYIYLLVDYIIWCKYCERSLALGGGCKENASRAHRVIDFVFLGYLLVGLCWFFLYLVFESGWVILVLSISQIPFLSLLYWSAIRSLKKKKVAAWKNRILSITLLTIGTFVYMGFLIVLIMHFDLSTVGKSEYRIVSWEISPNVIQEYRQYSDEIPLTCADLYGSIEYDNYSYEETVDRTPFVTRSGYRQDSLPEKDAPPSLVYEILKPRFHFVYALAKQEYLEIPEWQEKLSRKPIDNELFGTLEAYQAYYENHPTGDYILLFEDRIITLNMEDPATPEQIKVIRTLL